MASKQRETFIQLMLTTKDFQGEDKPTTSGSAVRVHHSSSDLKLTMGDVVAIAPVSTAKRPDLTTANLAAQMSNISILPAKHAVPQSARSYLQAENLLDPRVKVKSRSETSSGTFSETEKRTGFLSKFLGKDNENQQDEPKKSRNTWFSKLAAKKKSAQLMHQLLRTSEDDTMGMVSMKWEDFLKLMREMGFEYDPSTAGSSVRFDPPDPKDVSITFHKPHPDPTLHPMMLREFAKKLKKNYGWCEADFLSAGTPPKNIKPTGTAAQATANPNTETDFLGRFFFDSSSPAPHPKSPKAKVEDVDNAAPTQTAVKTAGNKKGPAAADLPEPGDGPDSPALGAAEAVDDVMNTPQSAENKKEPVAADSCKAGEGLSSGTTAAAVEGIAGVVPNTATVQSTDKKEPAAAHSPEACGKPLTALAPSLPASPTIEQPALVKSPLSNLSSQTATVPSFPVEQTAPQSGHAYRKAEGKTKIKSRPVVSSSTCPKKKQPGFIPKFSRSRDEKNKEEKQPKTTGDTSFPSEKKSRLMNLLDQLNEVGRMKWDRFVQLMREAGFKEDPSAAGSRVRFDPGSFTPQEAEMDHEETEGEIWRLAGLIIDIPSCLSSADEPGCSSTIE